MKGCCGEPGCRRRQPMTIVIGDLSGQVQVWVVTRRRLIRDHGNGRATFAAVERHDITEQFRAFLHNNAVAVRAMMSERDEDLTESGLSAHGHLRLVHRQSSPATRA